MIYSQQNKVFMIVVLALESSDPIASRSGSPIK